MLHECLLTSLQRQKKVGRLMLAKIIQINALVKLFQCFVVFKAKNLLLNFDLRGHLTQSSIPLSLIIVHLSMFILRGQNARKTMIILSAN